MAQGKLSAARAIIREHDQHILHWLAPQLAERLERDPQTIRAEGLLCTDFPLRKGVRVAFEDGSELIFAHAFSLEHDGAIAVFTEHCGYYLFSASSVTVAEITPPRRR